MRKAVLILVSSLLTVGCGINWSKIIDAIPGPGPKPTPPIIVPTQDPPTPPVEPTPAPCVIAPGGTYELLPRVPPPVAMVADVSAAMAAVAGVERCDGTCRSSALAYQADLDRVVAMLQGQGYCAGRQVEGAPEIAVQADGSDEVWTFQPYEMGGWKCMCPPSKAEPPDRWRLTSPPVVEPPVVAEPAPCPVVGRLDLGVMWLAARSMDVTPKALGLEVCTALGFVGRAECPLGQEIEGRPNPDRIRCEAEAGPYSASIDGVPVGTVGSNPLLFWAGSAGKFEVCSRAGICASKVLD